MSVSKWAYTPEVCDGGGCPGDCDLCDKPKNMEDEDDDEVEGSNHGREIFSLCKESQRECMGYM